jgi:transmembrane sensor
MSRTEPSIEEEAVRWVIRLKDAGSADWAEFTEWLEADPEHLEAYELMALVDEDAGALPRRKPIELTGNRRPEPQRGSSFSRRRMFGGLGAAGAVVLMVGVVTTRGPVADSTYQVATAPGEQRTIELADGSRIDLNGATRIVLDREQPRLARLEQGEALFTVVHKASDPFQVRAADNLIYDVGTVFNVVHSGQAVRVAVAEGEVVFNPDREKVNLTPGMSLEKEGGDVSVSRGAADSAGAWKQGRLVYSGAAVSEIAADLSRNLGVEVRADRAVSERTFSGVLRLDGEPQAVLARASALLGLRAKRLNEGWILSSE